LSPSSIKKGQNSTLTITLKNESPDPLAQ
jgi:hypothetical protein